MKKNIVDLWIPENSLRLARTSKKMWNPKMLIHYSEISFLGGSYSGNSYNVNPGINKSRLINHGFPPRKVISHLPKRHPDKTTQVFFSPLQSCSPNLVTTNKIAKRFITYYIYYFSFGFYQIYKFDLSWGFQGVRLSLLWHFQRFGLSTGDPWLPLSLSLVGAGEWRIPAVDEKGS